MSKKPATKLKIINRFLLGLIIAINGYILITPFLPKVQYEITQRTSKPIDITKPDEMAAIDRSYNHLIIPTIRLDKQLVEGTDPDVLFKGIWRRPNGSTPDKGSNTVLAGHRFGYRPEMGNFYHLDKVKVGDSIMVVWNQSIYIYRVNEIKVVEPSAVYIENLTKDDRVTLYTCTPIWSAKQRLVLVAGLEETR